MCVRAWKGEEVKLKKSLVVTDQLRSIRLSTQAPTQPRVAQMAAPALSEGSEEGHHGEKK